MIATYKHAFEQLQFILTDVSGALDALRPLAEDSPPKWWGDVMSAMEYMCEALRRSREYEWPPSAQHDMELIDAGVSMSLAWLTELSGRLFAASYLGLDQLELFDSLPLQYRPEYWEEDADR